MAKDSFILYKSFWKPIASLSDEALGRLFRALYCYQLGEQCEVDSDIYIAYFFFKNQFEIDENKYDRKVENIRNARNQARSRNTMNRDDSMCIATNHDESAENGSVNVNVNDNVNVNVNVNDNVSLYVRKNAAELMSADIPEREKFILILYSRNIINPVSEYARFTACYEGKGEKPTYGKAYLWKPAQEGNRFPDAFLDGWAGIIASVPANLREQALSDAITYEVKGGKAWVRCGKDIRDWIFGAGNAAARKYLLTPALPPISFYNN